MRVLLVEELDSGTLVVMMDNTLVDQSITSLFKNTVRFGTVAVLVILLLAVVLARQIVKPLQEAYARRRL